MSYDFSGTGYLQVAANPLPAGSSGSIVAWWQTADYSDTQRCLVSLGAAATSTHYISLQKAGTTGRCGVYLNDGTGDNSVVSAPAAANSTWMMYMAGWTAGGAGYIISDDHVCAWNGTSDTGSIESAATSAITALNWPAEVLIAARRNGASTFTLQLVGSMAHVAIFDGTLSYAEFQAMQTTAPPNVATAATCVAYWPLLINAEAAIGGSSYNLTANGDAALNSGVGPSITPYGAAPATILPLAARLMTMNGGMIDLT